MAKIPVQYRQRQMQARYVKKEIMYLLEWDELAYGNFQFKCGCAYLQNYIPKDPEGIDMLIKESLFWSWWKNRWTDRDECFLLIKFEPGDDIIKYYHRMHSPVELAKEIQPTAIALGSSYALMINQIQDIKTNQP